MRRLGSGWQGRCSLIGGEWRFVDDEKDVDRMCGCVEQVSESRWIDED